MMIDELAGAVVKENRDSLGEWIRRRYEKGVKDKIDKAVKIIVESGESREGLTLAWDDHKRSRVSFQMCTSTKLYLSIIYISHIANGAQIKRVIKTIQPLQQSLEEFDGQNDKLTTLMHELPPELRAHIKDRLEDN